MELLSALTAVSPLIATVVVLVLLALVVIEKLFGVNGPWSRLSTWIANRELNQQKRQSALEEQNRLAQDSRVNHVLGQNQYLSGELEKAVAALRMSEEARATERAQHDQERRAERERHEAERERHEQALDIQHRLLDSLTRAAYRHAAWDDEWVPRARAAGIDIPDPPPTLIDLEETP